MPQYDDLLKQVLGDEQLAYATGAVGDDATGYQVGEEVVVLGDDNQPLIMTLGADTIEGSYDVCGVDVLGRKVIRRKTGGRPPPRIARPPARHPIPRGLPPPARQPPKSFDQFDEVYGGAYGESGSQIPDECLLQVTLSKQTAEVFSFDRNAPTDFVLTTIFMSENAIADFQQAQLTIGGNPVGGRPFMSLTRFRADSTDRRLPPVEVKGGIPITFNANVVFTGGGTRTYQFDIMGTPINAGPSLATRRR